MKKLLMGIFGLTLLLPFGVFAEEINSVEDDKNKAETTVTVGTVEVPVYAADIYWADATFDWAYNKETKTFGWMPTPTCYPESGIDSFERWQQRLENGITLYTDDTCSTKSNSYNETAKYYTKNERETVHIGIEDFSKYGEIVPSVTWTSADEYKYVDGKFNYVSQESACELIDSEVIFEGALNNENTEFNKGIRITIYNDNECKNIVEDRNIEYEENKYYALFTKEIQKELSNSEIPEDGRLGSHMGPFYDELLHSNRNMYSIYLKLENKEKPTTTPTAGDTIGTITVTIRARETE